MTLQQMAKAQDGAFVRDRLLTQLNTGEAAHRLAVIQRVLSTWIRKIEPLLQEINAQHPLTAQRPASLTRHRIMWLDQRQQPCPRNHRLHLREKLFATRALLLRVISQPCKSRLFHLAPSSFVHEAIITKTCSEIP